MDSQIIWSPGVKLDAIEKQIILVAFRHYRGNKTATASALGISVRTLDNKLEQYKQDGIADKERQDSDRKKREDFLARQRGPRTPNNLGIPDTVPRQQETRRAAAQFQNGEGERETDVHSAASGSGLESADGPSTQPEVPVSEREKVQTVLPSKPAANHPSRRR